MNEDARSLSSGHQTTVERSSDRELVITQTVRGPANLVFKAWTDPELFKRWWAPKSFGVKMLSYEADVRAGGSYRAVLKHSASDQPMTFFGRYIEVAPVSRLVWTNEEGEGDGPVTTVTFEDNGGTTLVIVSELYPSKDALDDALASGSTSGWNEQFAQLDELLAVPAVEGAA